MGLNDTCIAIHQSCMLSFVLDVLVCEEALGPHNKMRVSGFSRAKTNYVPIHDVRELNSLLPHLKGVKIER